MRKLLFVFLLAPMAALAGPRDDVYSASQHCAGIGNDQAWLNCYYGAAQPMRQTLHLTPAPAGQVALVPGFAPSPAAPSPMTAAPPPAAPLVSRVDRSPGLFGGTTESNVALRSYSFDQKGRFTITLANGEVWQQAASETWKAKWTEPASFYTVAIRRSGATNVLEISGDESSYKVERVR